MVCPEGKASYQAVSAYCIRDSHVADNPVDPFVEDVSYVLHSATVYDQVCATHMQALFRMTVLPLTF